MVWRRLPSYFPNLPLKLIPLTEAQQTAYEKTGFLRRLAFRTLPSVNKVRPGVGRELQCERAAAGRAAAAAVVVPAALQSVQAVQLAGQQAVGVAEAAHNPGARNRASKKPAGLASRSTNLSPSARAAQQQQPFRPPHLRLSF